MRSDFVQGMESLFDTIVFMCHNAFIAYIGKSMPCKQRRRMHMPLVSQSAGKNIKSLQINAPQAILVHLVAIDNASSIIAEAPEEFSIAIEPRQTRIIVRIGDSASDLIVQASTGAIAQGPGSVAAGSGGIAIRGNVIGSTGVPEKSRQMRKGEARITFPSELEVFFTNQDTRYSVEGNVRLA